jgi:CRP-like cAMP-binding protein
MVGFAQPAAHTIERPLNRLLARLPDEEFRSLQPHLRTVPLEPRQILHKQGERLHHLYFPNGGVVSMATLLPEGTMAEAATIGDDGVVGVEAFFGGDAVSACETIVQVPSPGNTAERMGIADFRRELGVCPAFRHELAQYLVVLYAVMARLIACNAHHQVEERCARWLLTMHDRMHGQDFYLSHEFLAAMLGVRRQSVSVVAATLRGAGLIEYSHGRVSVRDRRGLEAAACECYPVVRALYDRVKS